MCDKLFIIFGNMITSVTILFYTWYVYYKSLLQLLFLYMLCVCKKSVITVNVSEQVSKLELPVIENTMSTNDHCWS